MLTSFESSSDIRGNWYGPIVSSDLTSPFTFSELHQMIPICPFPITTQKIEASTTTRTTILNENGAVVELTKDFIQDAAASFQTLLDEIKWTQETVVVCGKHHTPARKTAAYGDTGTKYNYSGTHKIPHHWSPNLLKLKNMVEIATGQEYNFVLCNLYPNGKAYVSYHSDDEKDIAPGSIIASISLGAERDFLLKRKNGDSTPVKTSLPSGSLLTMEGSTQRNWRHSVPIRTKLLGSRVNLTFRQIIVA